MTLEYLSNFSDSDYAIETLQLFQDVDDEAVFTLLATCPVWRVSKDDELSSSSGKQAHLYVVLRGALSVTSGEKTGMDEDIVTNVLPGECVGELSVLDEHSPTPTIVSLQETDVLAIEASKLWQMIDQSNGVARNLLHLLSFRIQVANARLRQRHKVGRFYRELSMLDGLTGLHNRAWLEGHLSELVKNAHARDKQLTLIMLDLDHFKQFNDKHGHLAGDDGLRTVARMLSEALRPTDFSVRYGGEEFMVILPDTEYDMGKVVAERLRERLYRAVVFADMRQPLPHITASFGAASLRAGQDAQALIAVADEALYRAKKTGRNRVMGNDNLE